MADMDINGPYDFVDKRVARGVPGASVLSGAANYDNVNDLRVVLFGISATKYSSARLDVMTKNDMIYAYRQEVDSGGIK